MKYLIIITTLLLAGCEGHYRYPCQDPANWDKKECNNEVCKAEGTCTGDVLGRNYSPKTESLEQSLDNDQSELNNSDNTDDFAKHTEPKPKKDNNVKQEVNTEVETQQEDLNRDVLDDQEAELTMDTIVETSEHNEAAK